MGFCESVSRCVRVPGEISYYYHIFFFFFFLVVLVKIHTEYSIHLGYDIFGKFLPLKSGAFSWRNGMESDLAF